MSKSATFQTKQNTSVVIGTEVTMGTACLAAGTTLEMPVTDYSFSEIDKHSLSVAPPRTGSGALTQSDDMVKWQRHDRMFDISLSFHATAQSLDRICLALFGDGTTPNALLGSMPSVTSYQHGVANIVPVTLWFENAGHDGEGVAMMNMHDLTTTTLDSEDLLLYSFELAIARPVNRIGFDGATFVPMGYSVGGYEVTGSLNCKRDGEVDDAIDNTAGMALDIDTGVFQITGEKVFVDEAGISMDDDGWKQSIPLRFTYDSAATSNPVVTIGTAA